MAANPKETTAIIRENAADHAVRPLFMRFEWTRWKRQMREIKMRYRLISREYNSVGSLSPPGIARENDTHFIIYCVNIN